MFGDPDLNDDHLLENDECNSLAASLSFIKLLQFQTFCLYSLLCLA